MRYVKRSCYVYDYPSTSARKLARVMKGRLLTGFKEKGSWSIVMNSLEKHYGYIKTSNLEGYGGGDEQLDSRKNIVYKNIVLAHGRALIVKRWIAILLTMAMLLGIACYAENLEIEDAIIIEAEDGEIPVDEVELELEGME